MNARGKSRGALVLALPAALLLLTFFVVPLAILARVSLYEGGGSSGFGIGGFYTPGSWTLANLREVATDPYFLSIERFTLFLGVVVTAITLAIAYPLAWFIHRLSPVVKTIALGLVLLPKLANLLVVVYGLEILLSASGPVHALIVGAGAADDSLELFHNLTGVVIGKTYLVVPYAVLILVVAFDRLDPALALAARGLGASAVRTFWTITFPLSLPGLALAAMVSFIWALGAFVSPYLLGSPEEITLAVEVQRQAFENVHWPRAAATAIAMLVLLSGSFFAFQFVLSRARARFAGPER